MIDVLTRLWDRLTANIDSTLMLIATLILSVGLFTLYSAAYENPVRLESQLVNIAVALAAMWVASRVPPQTLMRFAVPIYVVGLLLLVGVALFGEVVNGARRWLHVGIVRFQPSEIMKIAMPLMLAWYFQHREADEDLPRQAREEDHEEPRGEDEDRGAEVGLARDEAGGDGEQQPRDHELAQPQPLLLAMEVPRQHERHGDLHDLGRLQRAEAEVQPPAGAVAHLAEERDSHQQRDPGDVDREGEAHQQLRVDLREHPERGEGHGEVAHLAHHAVHRGAARGRVDHRGAQRHDEGQGGHEGPVDATREELEGAADHVSGSNACLAAGFLPSR